VVTGEPYDVTVTAKSGPVGTEASTVNRIVAVCDSVPEVPTKLTVTALGVAGASLAAVSVTTSGLPGVIERVVGEAVTPVGRPFTATPIVPLKPLIAVLLNVT
jgi:hypothetical protein